MKRVIQDGVNYLKNCLVSRFSADIFLLRTYVRDPVRFLAASLVISRSERPTGAVLGRRAAARTGSPPTGADRMSAIQRVGGFALRKRIFGGCRRKRNANSLLCELRNFCVRFLRALIHSRFCSPSANCVIPLPLVASLPPSIFRGLKPTARNIEPLRGSS